MDMVVTSFDGAAPRIDVSIVMPCLNEVQCLPHCLANAKAAAVALREELGLVAEIIVADNGSDDGSQLLARALGARVVDVTRRGYGAALIGGFEAASGDYLVMGDADGSYDFRECVGLVRLLVEGADLAMGSRFRGGVAPGAMPWKNRYIGNPALTGVLNLFFRAGIDDAHCGLRALTRDCFQSLNLSGQGMEFASEMVIKAALKRARIAEAPVTLSKDIRDRPPHLRPWRDGWRHLRYLFMLSPNWAFQAPAALVAACSLAIWAAALHGAASGDWRQSQFGNYWVVLAGAMLGLAHIASLMGMAAHLHGRRKGFRPAYQWESGLGKLLRFETMLLAGLAALGAGAALLVGVLFYWSSNGAIGSVLPAVAGTTLMVIGAQNALGGMLLAVVNDHDSDFAAPAATPASHAASSDRRAA